MHDGRVSFTPPEADAFELPAGWSVERQDADRGIIVAPEGDLRVYFAVDESSDDLEATALRAWRAFAPNFDFGIRQKSTGPGEDGWESFAQFVYNVPLSERRMVAAFIRTLAGRAYINLADGSGATFARRGEGQFSEIVRSWKPAGLVAPDFSDRKAILWGEEQTAELRSFIEQAMLETRVPGVSIAIVQNGRIILAQGFGVRATDSDEPVTPSSRFMIGSTTKPLTTLMMAKEIEGGRFTWDTRVLELLPDFALGDAEATRTMRMRDTVSASTGMPRRDIDFIFKYKGVSPETRIEQMRTMVPTTKFGETFQYSNFLVSAGGYAAARAYEASEPLKNAYEQAMHDHVFEPLRMRDTTIGQERALTGECAMPHGLNFDGQCERIPLQMEGSVDSVAPAGAAWSTASDIARYVLMELAEGQLPTGQTYLSREALLARRHGIRIDEKTGYGLGLMTFSENGIDFVGHAGNTMGFTADMFFLPRHGFGAVILTNRQAANDFTTAVRLKLFEMLFGIEPKAQEAIRAIAASRDQNVEQRKSLVRRNTASIPWLDDLVGRYSSDELGVAEISRRRSGHWIEFESWGSEIGVSTSPDSERTLFLINPPWSGALRLLADDTGKRLTISAGQSLYTFERTD